MVNSTCKPVGPNKLPPKVFSAAPVVAGGRAQSRNMLPAAISDATRATSASLRVREDETRIRPRFKGDHLRLEAGAGHLHRPPWEVGAQRTAPRPAFTLLDDACFAVERRRRPDIPFGEVVREDGGLGRALGKDRVGDAGDADRL